jgi:hypothetical protein
METYENQIKYNAVRCAAEWYVKCKSFKKSLVKDITAILFVSYALQIFFFFLQVLLNDSHILYIIKTTYIEITIANEKSRKNAT